jgi:hypothetical protein
LESPSPPAHPILYVPSSRCESRTKRTRSEHRLAEAVAGAAVAGWWQSRRAVAASVVQWRLAGGTAARPSPAVARYVAAGRNYAPFGAPLTGFAVGDPTLATQDPIVALALAVAGQRAVEADEGGSGLMSVTATARGPSQAGLTLHVIVRINGRPERCRYEILAYERLPDEQP